MIPGQVITLRPDKRYKLGNVVKDKKGALRGHPKTIYMERYYADTVMLQMNPPIVISSELGAAIKKELA